MEIALVVLSVMSVSFLIAYLMISHKLNAVSKGFAQLFIAYDTLKETIDGKATKTEEDIHKENFIKFLSDSRDWAFDYIEDVQKGLSKFIKEVEPQLEYYNQYKTRVGNANAIYLHECEFQSINEEDQVIELDGVLNTTTRTKVFLTKSFQFGELKVILLTLKKVVI